MIDILGIILKRCLGCKEKKQRNEFTKSKRERDGRSDYCLVCHRARGRAYYWRDKLGEPIKRRNRSKKERVLESIKAGHRTQASIARRTGIAKDVVAEELTQLVLVDRKVKVSAGTHTKYRVA